MSEDVKSHLIAFRVTNAEWRQIEEAAAACGEENPNEWGRKIVLGKAGESTPMTRNERIIFEEIARTRLLLTQGFLLLSKQQLNATEWKQITELAGKHSRKIGDALLAQSVGETV